MAEAVWPCFSCKQLRVISEFVQQKRKHRCKPCQREYSRQYRNNNPEKIRKYRESRAEEQKSYWQERYQSKKHELLPRMRERYGRIKGTEPFKKQRRSAEAKHRAAKLSATPAWANEQKIKEIYMNCPDGFHVDHVVPLKGKNVCGLHVEYNLQYLPAQENLSKGNCFSGVSS